jgi:peptide/nickel transport system substrate-binding protein
MLPAAEGEDNSDTTATRPERRAHRRRSTMRMPLRARAARLLVALGLALSTILPAASVAGAQEDLILRVGTDQDLQVLNPFNSVVVADFEVFTLNYDLLVNFGPNLEPAPGFADTWEQDGTTWTFHIREGMKWSDGQPATSEDALYTYQLILDAVASERGYLGQGYLEPYLTDAAGMVSVSAPDAQTLVVETETPNTLITQAYVPIIPKHIWSQYTLEQIGDPEGAGYFKNEPPVVGTGPYVATEWVPGDHITFSRNPNYWGEQKGAEDQIILQHFASGDTMVQALKTGEVDYVRGVLADQFNALKSEPNIATVEGAANGYTELSFNTGGNKEGYGGSTAALSDPAFRDALGYAIDQQELVDTTLGGYGTPGDTIIPPFHTRWHVAPEKPRTFDIEEAKTRLEAAGYELDSNGKRLDKEGNPINLRLTWPDSEAENATNAEFIADWFGQLGIDVNPAVTEEGALIDAVTGPPNGPADYDIYMWGWVGDPDPNSLLVFFQTSEIGSSSDSYYSNPDYDEMYTQQRQESDPEKRKQILADMQNLVYDEAPYIILYYDAELHAYRTDKFGGWTNQPTEGGTPLFGYGSGGYNVLTSVAPAASSLTSMLPIILGVAALVVVIAVGLIVMRGRRRTAVEEE